MEWLIRIFQNNKINAKIYQISAEKRKVELVFKVWGIMLYLMVEKEHWKKNLKILIYYKRI
jgi:hypothetical protein